ncbi:hypothetical protein BsWGS_16093 [Bradybaena similaris]
MKVWTLWLVLFVINNIGVNCSLSDATSSVFSDKLHSGIVAAFGDFNADKATDIFVLSENGKSLFILEADIDIRQMGAKFNNKSFIEIKDEDAVIVNIVPGDFNSDSQMDVLVMRKNKTDKTHETHVTVEIYVGNGTKGTRYLTVNETFRDQPIVIDGNGDMAPDLFGETVEGKRALWTFKSGTYQISYYHGNNDEKLAPLKIPQSSAFLDLDGDLNADLCAVTDVNGTVVFELWLNVGGNLTHEESISAPKALKVVGQASYADLNGDGGMNIILPGCLDESCKESAIFVWSHNKYSMEGSWDKLDVNFKKDQDQTLYFPKTVKPTSWLTLHIVIRMGDFNLDGFPDAVTILSDTNGRQSPFILYNVECGTGCPNFSRTFSIESVLQKDNTSLISFFDLMEDGVLDILLTVEQNGAPVIQAVQQDFTGDASFLKVMVLSGLCEKNCPDRHSPYGVNQVGPTARYESTTPTGSDQIGIANQLSQSSYLSLQLPFMLFGLGQTPNFVDELQVGIPFPPGKQPRNHSWSGIIPNSQIIVIPYPVDDPDSWKHELYVTPSRLVLLTGVSLLGTCVFIAAIVGLLQWRERMEDKKEKLQEAQRFHFDAM